MGYQTTNPYTGEVVKTFETATEAEIDAAIAKADAAFATWRDTPVEDRVAVLSKAADILEENTREYAEVLTLEMGKMIDEAEGEVALCANILRYYVDHAAELLAPRPVAAKGYGDMDVVVVHEPQGVIYAVEPWNFPFYQVIRVSAPQLSAGNTLVLKHASIVPQSALKMEELFKEAGGPEGLLVNVFASHESNEQILADERVRGVALTGSEGAGAAVAQEAAKNLKKSTLELGGSDAFIVLDDADLDKVVDWALLGRHWNGGQVCTSCKRMIIADSLYDEFLEKYRAKVATLKPGDPMDSSTTLPPLSSQSAADELAELVARAREEGVTVEEVGEPVPQEGSFFQPTILTDIPADSRTSQTEFFGPVSQVYRAKDDDDAVRIANSSPYGLGGSIYSRDVRRAQELARRIDTGMVFINQPTGVAADIPFGGVKRSGYGRELTELGLTEFTNQKVVAVADIDGEFF